jgi:hypothetical protein
MKSLNGFQKLRQLSSCSIPPSSGTGLCAWWNWAFCDSRRSGKFIAWRSSYEAPFEFSSILAWSSKAVGILLDLCFRVTSELQFGISLDNYLWRSWNFERQWFWSIWSFGGRVYHPNWEQARTIRYDELASGYQLLPHWATQPPPTPHRHVWFMYAYMPCISTEHPPGV